jgi:hypothetical protein
MMMAVNKITWNVFEVLQKVSAAKKKADKISILKQNDSTALRTVIQGCYHPGINLDLPEVDPPYEACDAHNAPSSLHRKWKDFGYFTGAHTKKLGKVKIEIMFIQLLESIHPEDAKIVLQMKAKKPFKGISSALVKEVYPNLIPPD